MGMQKQLWLLIGILILTGCTSSLVKKVRSEYDLSGLDKQTANAYVKVYAFLQDCMVNEAPVKASPDTKIDTIMIDRVSKTLEVKLNPAFAYIPFREKNTVDIYRALRERLGGKYRRYVLKVYAGHYPIRQLIPNYFRKSPREYDETRLPGQDFRGAAIVRNLSKPWQPTRGLSNRHIALWPSHGWYYEHKLNRWEWQRARLFETVEDLLPMSFVVPYLAPMLENAGARVFLPRERDIQTNEVIVDNDSPDSVSVYLEQMGPDSPPWRNGAQPGFAVGSPPYGAGVNPFKSGTYRRIPADTAGSAQISWIPDFPESGDYAVYISYASIDSSIQDALYTVYHSGGQTQFLVNQRIGGGTWIYLDTFKFKSGKNPDSGKVVLNNRSGNPQGIVTADALRFGGGMGNVARNGTVSGRPRFEEGARYYLQYAGMPDTLVYNVTEEPANDYIDDYRGRGEWVNYLKGAPFGPNKQRTVAGLGIPIDLSLAFHTDAGSRKSERIPGTLMIVSIPGADSTTVFPDGMSRLANRDFGDILQTQIVEDIRRKYDPDWERRSLWDKPYSEAYRPNVPAALLELLFHDSFQDMKFALDPRFRFDASRAIYKGMLKFIATQHNESCIVQPLPVTHFQALFTRETELLLRWRPALDSLETNSEPEKYLVYTRIEDNGFDNGVLVEQPEIRFRNLQPGLIYSFKVTAVNAGGESFPSEILPVCRMNNRLPTVLIVNGFDRVSPPATLEAGGLQGFADFWDQGVPDRYDLSYIGSQFEFDSSSHWTNDDSPGHGASHANFETRIIPGNTFDFAYIHGAAIRSAGYSFVSASDEAAMDSLIELGEFAVIDLLLGEEKETPWPRLPHNKQFQAFPEKLQHQLSRYCESGGNLFISGAYVGSDLFQRKDKEHRDAQFGRETLKLLWRTNYGAKTGLAVSADSSIFAVGDTIIFNTQYHRHIYAVEAPDAIDPADSTARTILRYAENNMSAAIAYQGNYRLVIMGFPFETILSGEARKVVMRRILRFLVTKVESD